MRCPPGGWHRRGGRSLPAPAWPSRLPPAPSPPAPQTHRVGVSIDDLCIVRVPVGFAVPLLHAAPRLHDHLAPKGGHRGRYFQAGQRTHGGTSEAWGPRSKEGAQDELAGKAAIPAERLCSSPARTPGSWQVPGHCRRPSTASLSTNSQRPALLTVHRVGRHLERQLSTVVHGPEEGVCGGFHVLLGAARSGRRGSGGSTDVAASRVEQRTREWRAKGEA